MPICVSNIFAPIGLCVPMEALDESWALSNHSQSLARLKERGGLSLCEAAAIIEKRRWRPMLAVDALAIVRPFLCIP
jgi:hypothetical protein